MHTWNTVHITLGYLHYSYSKLLTLRKQSYENTRADWLRIMFNSMFNQFNSWLTLWKRRTSTTCWRYDGASKENFHFDNKHLHVMTGPKENSEFCFPETLNGTLKSRNSHLILIALPSSDA